jgi:branched-chain amino acid transport system substrate-binding protein
MKKTMVAAGAILALAAGPALAQSKSVKIGFVSTFSGPTAVIGNDMRNSFELALDHIGRKMGGLPVEVIYEDDGQKPEQGKQKTEKLIESDKVDFVVGYIWSNVLLASLKPVLDSKTFLISANAGPSQIAGELCSEYFFSTSWQNDQTPQSIGTYMNTMGVKSVYLLGPNYAAGKDMLAGVASTYKGQVIGQDLTKWPDQLDFSAELTKVKAAKPGALFVFYPGAAGVQFLNQYVQSGLKGEVPLFTAFTIDSLSLPRQGDNALGIPGAQHWVNDLQGQAQSLSVLLRRAELRRRRPDQLGRGCGQGRPDQERRHARGDAQGQLQVGARTVQIRQQPLPDPEFLSAGCGQGCRRRAHVENRGDHRQGQPGRAREKVPDEVVRV